MPIMLVSHCWLVACVLLLVTCSFVLNATTIRTKIPSILLWMLGILLMWSWRESNPRPNRETIRFLHAYSGLRFSCCGKTRTTNHNLISLDFIPCAEPHETISDLTAPLYRNASEQQLPSDVSSCHLVTGLSQ